MGAPPAHECRISHALGPRPVDIIVRLVLHVETGYDHAVVTHEKGVKRAFDEAFEVAKSDRIERQKKWLARNTAGTKFGAWRPKNSPTCFLQSFTGYGFAVSHFDWQSWLCLF